MQNFGASKIFAVLRSSPISFGTYGNTVNHHISYHYPQILKIFFLTVAHALMFRIVLDAGYFLHIRAFFDNFGTILLYAVVVSITCNYFPLSRH